MEWFSTKMTFVIDGITLQNGTKHLGRSLGAAALRGMIGMGRVRGQDTRNDGGTGVVSTVKTDTTVAVGGHDNSPSTPSGQAYLSG